MERLILVRHALSGSNRDGLASCTFPGDGLTPEGREQALALRGVLDGTGIDLGVATDFARTRETLELALGDRDVARIVVPELNEIHFGRFDGAPLDEYRAWAATELPSTLAPGGGESRAAAAARFASGIQRLLERPERTALVVAHALVVRYVLDAAEGLVPAARMSPVEHARPFPVGAAAARDAASLLAEWSRDPRFRDPSPEGRARV
jgi:broad specificity phosphatase PhoE